MGNILVVSHNFRTKYQSLCIVFSFFKLYEVLLYSSTIIHVNSFDISLCNMIFKLNISLNSEKHYLHLPDLTTNHYAKNISQLHLLT